MTSLLRMYRFLKPFKIQATIALLILLGMVAADLAIPHLTQRIIDQGIAAGDMHCVVVTALWMVGASVISVLLALFNNYLSVNASMGFGAGVRRALMRQVQSFSFGNLDRIQTGALIVRSTSDVNQVQMIVMLSLRIMTRAPIWAAGSIALLVLTSPHLALTISFFLPVIIVLIWMFARNAHRLFKATQQRLDRLNTVLQENLAGIRIVKAFVRTRHETQRFESANQDLMTATIQAGQLAAFFIPILLLMLNLAVVSAVWLGGRTAIDGGMTTGEVVAAINYLSFALFPILLLGAMLGPLASAEASAGRILEILDTRPLIPPGPGRALPSPLTGQVEFNQVSFSYFGSGSEPVLSDITLTARPGETVAVIGATGSGKSTLVHLMPRFHDISSGAITLDGMDIRNIDTHQLRSVMAVVLQDPVLFGGTIKSNIAYGRPDASDEDIKTAARTSQAHEFISRLPQGYNTTIGQRGVTLSGGQRQRISIARALLMNPRILILDDPASALDTETELRFLHTLDAWAASCAHPVTRFVVAQRITSVLRADQILVLDQGRPAALGTHGELMEDSPIYRDIYRSQLGDLPTDMTTDVPDFSTDTKEPARD